MMMGAFGSTILAINNGYVGDFQGFANGGTQPHRRDCRRAWWSPG